jgi:hypothetical protein
MSAEYHFAYKKAKPNRFPSRMKASPVVVVLDPDVAKVFTYTEEVNNALRALIAAVPEHHAISRKNKTVLRNLVFHRKDTVESKQV